MPENRIPLLKGDKIGVETDYRDALPQNMYAVEKQILGTPGYMLQYPGLVELATGIGVDRGANYNERFSELYRVSGKKLISVSSAGVVTELGTISGNEQVRLTDFYSLNTQGIIADGMFLLYSPSGGLVHVTDPDVGEPIDGVWVDGFYFMTDGEYLFHTDLANETAINPLAYSTSEFSPDPTLGLSITQDDKVMVWNRYSLEYFVKVGTANFAFQRIETRAQKIGIVATHAKCEIKGTFYITGGYRESALAIYKVGLGDSVKVSTREIDKILSKYTEPELSDMRMECRVEDGTAFILVHLPEETLCFNETIASKFGMEVAWCTLVSGIAGNNYRAINGVLDPRSSDWVYGDKGNGTIGILSDVSTHYGELAEWMLFTPFILLEKMSIDAISLETIPGHTNDIEAKVAFSITHDGVTYSTEDWALYGEPHDYGQRYIRRRLGYVPDWVGFKFRGASASRMSFALMTLTYS